MRLPESKVVAANERGTLLIAVLVILLVITILGLSTMKASGLEMQMSSNSREQLMMLETAEYVIARVTNEIHTLGGFSANSLANAECGNRCFDETCSGGYCFFGAAETGNPLSWQSCAVGLPALDPSSDAALWADGSGRYIALAIPGSDTVARYIIEFRCYAAIDNTVPMDAANNTQQFRITALVASTNGRSGAMLRVTVKNQ